jgi:glutamate-1-semialdehyde 2,1-aminomutase
MMNDSYTKRLLKVIPGGAHTYSRGFDQFPSNAPQILKNGLGAYTFDEAGNRFLDYGMSLRAVHLGYAQPEINEAAIAQINNGNNLTRASLIELEAAELLVDLIDSVDMVKFTKNGSTAVSAAIKLARAYTGREMIARCVDHPFFSYDDWFIASTPITRGIPAATIEQTKTFQYNNITSLIELIDKYPKSFACVVLEPSTMTHPCASNTHVGENYLHDVKRVCQKHGIVFILDEMITGFRWHIKGAQHYYNVHADLSTFGKAMANGFSVAAIGGKREIMELGAIEKEGSERLFLLSTTHGAEMSGLGAFVATMKFMHQQPVIDHLWTYGEKLIDLFNQLAKSFDINDYIFCSGIVCSPGYTTLDKSGQPCLAMRTLFSQEMIKGGVLMPWIALSYQHGDTELALTKQALTSAFSVYKQALEKGVDQFLIGDAIKPVFRRIN